MMSISQVTGVFALCDMRQIQTFAGVLGGQAVQLLPIFSEALRKYPLGQLSTPAELLSSM